MSFRWLIILGTILIIGCSGADKNGTAEAENTKEDTITTLESQLEKVSYTIGQDIGSNLQQQGIEIDVDVLAKGIKDALLGNESLLTDAEKQTVMAQFQQEMQAKQQAQMEEQAAGNLTASEEFLAENSGKEGVVTLESGLQYKVIEEGTGPSPSATDTVVVHYSGTLVDGTEFDSSYQRGRPAEFPVNGVIPGWTEALQLMKEGGKWEVFIPPDLAYGERGAGQRIGPNAALIFEVELIEVK